ncbi:hypothetical protein KY284_037631 [Solanum tuberosum]|nr:hypothetical protein KY284_037631 [Solanum tuberosum]
MPRYKGLRVASDCENPRVLVQVEDLYMVQTPPSVSSSTAIAPPSLLLYTNNFHNNNLASPVKPVPERRTVTATVSTISSETCYEAFSSPVKGVKMSKAQQSSGDDRASHVSISRKEYGHQQGAASWLVLAIPRNIASDESII